MLTKSFDRSLIATAVSVMSKSIIICYSYVVSCFLYLETPPTPTINVTDTGLSIMDVEWSIPGDLPQKFELEYFPTNNPNDTQVFVASFYVICYGS